MHAGSASSVNAGRRALSPFGAPGAGLGRLPMLRIGLESAAAALADELEPLTPGPPRLQLQGLKGDTAQAAFFAHAGRSAIGVLDAAGWGGRCYLSADRDAVCMIVDLLLGADATQPAAALDRPPSKMETRVAGVFFTFIAKVLAAAFAPIAETTFALETTWAEPDFDEISVSEPVVTAGFRLEQPGRAGEILLLIPQATLDAVRKPLAAEPVQAAPRPDAGWEQSMRQEITRAQVALSAILDERKGTLGEVAVLRVGQVLEINATVQSRVCIEANGERLMWAQLGKSNGVYTLRVDEFVNREQEFMQDILSS
jgi:flagellar motor switch protein FliM